MTLPAKSSGRCTIEVVVWDFDGVLNRNIVDGRFIWSDTFEQDLGQPLAPFQQKIFGASFNEVLVGRLDLLDLIADWVRESGFAGNARQVLDYWFAADQHLDHDLLGVIEQLSEAGLRNVIATNNDPRRSDYIENQMGLGPRIERIFTSGRIGSAKPDPAFFEHVQTALAIKPARLLLIDDNRDNTAMADQLGWQTHLYGQQDSRALEHALGLTG